VNRVNAQTQNVLWRFTWTGVPIAAEVFLCHPNNGFTITLYADRRADRIEVCLKANGNSPMQGIVKRCHTIDLTVQCIRVSIFHTHSDCTSWLCFCLKSSAWRSFEKASPRFLRQGVEATHS